MDTDILEVGVSLKKPAMKFGPWLCEKMNHSGLVLYLILYHEEIDILSGSKPVGLEVNLPTGLQVYMGTDELNHGRKKLRTDLTFKKDDNYYLVDVKSKRPTLKDRKKMEEYVERFKENLGVGFSGRIIPIIVFPADSISEILVGRHI